MEMDDEIVESRSSYRDVRQSFRPSPLTIYLGLIGLVIVGLALWRVWDKLIYLGYFLMGLIGLAGLMGVVALYFRLRRMRQPIKQIHIHKDGTILYNEATGKTTIIAPQAITAPKAPREQSLKPVAAKQVVPKMAELLAANVLGPGMPQILMGVQEGITPRWGTMDGEIKSVGIGGRGRSGKTVTMLFFIIQHLFQYTEVWLADPHYNKPSGLSNMLGPLCKWVRVYRSADEIRQMFVDLDQEIKLRKSAPAGTFFRRLVVIGDEWNGILEEMNIEAEENDEDSYAKTAAALVTKVEREMAGYEMYCLLGVHSWTDRDIGGTNLRRLIHSVLCHRMPADYSHHILPKKQAALTEGLRTGHAIFRDNEGYCEKLMIPYTTSDDAITAATMLEAAITGQQTEDNLQLGPSNVLSLPQKTSHQQIADQQVQPQTPTRRDEDLYGAPTIELKPVHQLYRQTGPLRGEPLQHLYAEEIEEEELVAREEDLALKQTQQVQYTAAEEIEFLKAVNALRVEQPGQKPGRVTILAHIRATVEAEQGKEQGKKWNRKKWAIIAALCDKYGL